MANTSATAPGCLTLLTLLLVAGKLFANATYSWWIALSPALFGAGVGIAILLIIFLAFVYKVVME